MRMLTKSFILPLLFATTAFSMATVIGLKEVSMAPDKLEKFIKKTNFDHVRDLPEPSLKKIDILKGPLLGLVVTAILPGERKIFRTGDERRNRYVLVPNMENLAVSLIVRGQDFVGVGHFVEDQNEQIAHFLRAVKEQNTPIEDIIIYGGHWTHVASAIVQGLIKENMSATAARIFPVFVSQRDNSLASIAIREMFNQRADLPTKDFLSFLKNQSMYPSRVAIDLVDGKIIDLTYLQKVYGDILEPLPYSYLLAHVIMHLEEKVSNGERLTFNERDLLKKYSPDMCAF
jgi:hypothetical protein